MVMYRTHHRKNPDERHPVQYSSKQQRQAALSLAWNARRGENLVCLAQGQDPPDAGCVRGSEGLSGWYLISRHASGVVAAYQAQRKLRKTWSDKLQFKVVNTQNEDTEWTAEIWARGVTND